MTINKLDHLFNDLSKASDLHWQNVERYTAQADTYRSGAARYRDLAIDALWKANNTDNAARNSHKEKSKNNDQ